MQPRDALLPFTVAESRQFADVSTCFSRKTEVINDSAETVGSFDRDDRSPYDPPRDSDCVERRK